MTEMPRARRPIDAPAPAGARAVIARIGGEDHLVIGFDAGPPQHWPRSLTRAEREIARLIVAGLSNAEISRLRQRSERTVANQVASILGKLGVGSRAEIRPEGSRPAEGSTIPPDEPAPRAPRRGPPDG